MKLGGKIALERCGVLGSRCIDLIGERQLEPRCQPSFPNSSATPCSPLELIAIRSSHGTDAGRSLGSSVKTAPSTLTLTRYSMNLLHTPSRSPPPLAVGSNESGTKGLIERHDDERTLKPVFSVWPWPFVTTNSDSGCGSQVQDRPSQDPGQARFELMLEEVVRNHQSRRKRSSSIAVKRSQCTTRDAFVAALQSFCMSHNRLHSFKSVPAVRSQLLAEFFHLHYAREGDDFFPSKMILILSPDTSSLTAATNALYLAQLATSARDEKLLRNATVAYRSAARLLCRDLSNPKACYDEHVFGTIHILSLCEAFKGTTMDSFDPEQHNNAVASMFEARGPKSLQSVYMMIQLQQHHHRILPESLLYRRRPLTTQRQWLDVDKNCHLRLTSLTTLVMAVPVVLQDANELAKRGRIVNPAIIMDMLTRLKSLETRIHSWMTAWYAKIQISPYCKVAPSTLSWLPKSNAFASALRFPTPLVAKAHVLYWMPLLSLHEMTREVTELHPFPLLTATANVQNEKLCGDIGECAANLCMTAMFLTNPANGIDGCMEACGPLLLASTWYEKINDYEKLDWCRQMFDIIDYRGIRAPRHRNRDG